MTTVSSTKTVGIYFPGSKHTAFTPVMAWSLDKQEKGSSLTYYCFWDDVLRWTHLDTLLGERDYGGIHVYAKNAGIRDRVLRLLEKEGETEPRTAAADDRARAADASSHERVSLHDNDASKSLCNKTIQAALERLLDTGGKNPYVVSGDLMLQTTDDVLASAGWFLQVTGLWDTAQSEGTNPDTNNPVTLKHGVLNTCIVLDATASDALFLWPPHHHDVQTNDASNTNTATSLWGLLRSHTRTPMGQENLKNWLRQPLRQHHAIQQRQASVAALVHQGVVRDGLHDLALRACASLDVWKLARQIDIEEGNKNADCKHTLEILYKVFLLGSQHLPAILEQLESFDQHQEEHQLITQLNDELRSIANDLSQAVALAEAVLDLDLAPREYVVKPSYLPDLQTIRSELDAVELQIDECLANFQETWSSTSGSKASAVKLEDDGDTVLFRLPNTNDTKILQNRLAQVVQVHKTLKNGVSFSTKNLRQCSTSRRELRAEYQRLSQQVVRDAHSVAQTYVSVLDRAFQAIGELDSLVGMAHATAYSSTPYCRPEILKTNEDTDPQLSLEQARHPCVELQTQSDHASDYIPNDVDLRHRHTNLLLVTGPNMGGKSTYIRSVATIVVLAQLGMYVPCTKAKLTVSDRILCRVGAGDYQDKGISTFLAEMLESSSILRTASRHSLIVIDELGRGTSTFDGYGLARAISEYLVSTVGNLTVLATHFHELTALESDFPPGSSTDGAVRNCHVTAQRTAQGLTFLYQVQPGPCLESFGVQVAELAGVPNAVVHDANFKALQLEQFKKPLNEDCDFVNKFAGLRDLTAIMKLGKSDEEIRTLVRHELTAP